MITSIKSYDNCYFAGVYGDKQVISHLKNKIGNIETWKNLDTQLASQVDNRVADIQLRVTRDYDGTKRLSGTVIPTKEFKHLFDNIIAGISESKKQKAADVITNLVSAANSARDFAFSAQKEFQEITPNNIEKFKTEILSKIITH